jgi:hypothetical protein
MKPPMIGLGSVVAPQSEFRVDFSERVVGKFIYILRCPEKLRECLGGDKFAAITNFFDVRKFGRC